MENRANETSRSNEDRTLKDLTPNVAGLLCYVAGWISGIVFLVLEQKNRFVRFHALQSIIVFGILTVASFFFGHLPVVGTGFSCIFGITGFVLWIILMVKAVQGEYFKLPWAGDLAERLTRESMRPVAPQPSAADSPASGGGSGQQGWPGSAAITAETAAYSAAAPAAGSINSESLRKASISEPRHQEKARKPDASEKYYQPGARTGRIVGSSFAITWAVILLVFFNFFNQYIAYYEPVYSTGITTWHMYTLVTSEFSNWLPILNTTLLFSIIGHAFLIAYDRKSLNHIVHIILNVFSVATIVTLLAIFPFDFSPIPNHDAVTAITIGLTVTLVVFAVCYGIGALVRFVQLIVTLVEGKY